MAKTDDPPFRPPLEAAANYFGSTESAPGRRYIVTRVPAWVGGWDSSTWYTYTNSLIVNNVVVIPSYLDGVDDVARRAYQLARPDLKVVSVNTDLPISSGGSVHCLTRQIPRVE